MLRLFAVLQREAIVIDHEQDAVAFDNQLAESAENQSLRDFALRGDEVGGSQETSLRPARAEERRGGLAPRK